ncbi:hypothetical protein HY312_02860 [Candidatus Saccharibacteria bacterium]|nr:hypothetical protein [Candidatus Saccharibacteria bacterium]
MSKTTFLQKRTFYVAVLLFIAIFTSALVLTQPTNAAEKVTVESFCKQFTETSNNYACKDGWKGADCSDYLITHDQAHVDICQKSARKAAEVGSGGDTPEPVETPTTNNSNNTSGLDTVKDVIDKISNSQEKNTDTKSEVKEDPKPDNVYGKYVNGNNKYQDIRVSRTEGTGKPAIIFFNGGGWHVDDGVGDKVVKWSILST